MSSYPMNHKTEPKGIPSNDSVRSENALIAMTGRIEAMDVIAPMHPAIAVLRWYGAVL